MEQTSAFAPQTTANNQSAKVSVVNPIYPSSILVDSVSE